MKRALFALTTEEAKVVLAKAVVNLPQVKSAMKHGRVLVSKGTTNAYIANELLGINLDPKYYTVGVIAKGSLCAASQHNSPPAVIIKDGKHIEADWVETLKEFDENDVLIKGANAVDDMGNCGVLLGSGTGGTVGMSFPIVKSRGAHCIIPVSLGKLVPSVVDAANSLGINRMDMTYGMPCGMAVVSAGALIITEIEAFNILFDVHAVHVASGGVCGSEGSVCLVLEGDDEKVEKAFEYVTSLKKQEIKLTDADKYEVMLADVTYKK